MPACFLPVHRGAALLAVGLLLGGCDAPLADSELDTAQRLHGTWLRESNEAQIHARRVLVLQPDGVFEEKVRIVESSGRTTEQARNEFVGVDHIHGNRIRYQRVARETKP